MQKYEFRYGDLVNTIVEQAVFDYRNALDGKGYPWGNRQKTPEEVIKEVEKFFRSAYFQELTRTNGEYLIGLLKKEHEEKVRKEECTLN